jgi:hypothetical protein
MNNPPVDYIFEIQHSVSFGSVRDTIDLANQRFHITFDDARAAQRLERTALFDEIDDRTFFTPGQISGYQPRHKIAFRRDQITVTYLGPTHAHGRRVAGLQPNTVVGPTNTIMKGTQFGLISRAAQPNYTAAVTLGFFEHKVYINNFSDIERDGVRMDFTVLLEQPRRNPHEEPEVERIPISLTVRNYWLYSDIFDALTEGERIDIQKLDIFQQDLGNFRWRQGVEYKIEFDDGVEDDDEVFQPMLYYATIVDAEFKFIINARQPLVRTTPTRHRRMSSQSDPPSRSTSNSSGREISPYSSMGSNTNRVTIPSNILYNIRT